MEEIVPGPWRIVLARGSVNAYVWRGEGGLTLVDCGYASDGRRILQSLFEAGYLPQDVHHIVITHGDIDHMGSLAQMQAATSAAVLAHTLEVDLIEGRRSRQWGQGLSGRLMALSYRLLLGTGLVRCEPAKVGRSLVDSETLDGGWRVVHTPGHTPGHISLHHPEQQVLITGDALGQRRGRLIGPIPAYAMDIKQAAASVRKLVALNPQILCFGHLRPLTNVKLEELRALAARL